MKLPDTAERARQELSLHITIGVPLIATEGYAAAVVRSTYTRAREVCRRLGETPEISQVLWGLWTSDLVRAELGTAREIAEEFLRVAEALPYSELAMEVTLFHLGDFARAIQHFERALLLYDPELHRDDAFRYSQNSGVGARCHAAWALWFLGKPDQALNQIEEALTLARELSEPHGLAHSLSFAAVVHQLRGEYRMAQERAEAAIAVSRDHGLTLYQASATIVRGWALIEQGRPDEAIELIRQGVAAHQAIGVEVSHSRYLALLAEGLNKAGRTEEGLHELEEALALAQRNGEQYYQAEIYRLKGELLLMPSTGRALHLTAMGGKAVVEGELPRDIEAEDCFNQAIKIAQRQNAKSLELRAVMSLARLCQNHG
jgi:predicted ATPase